MGKVVQFGLAAVAIAASFITGMPTLAVIGLRLVGSVLASRALTPSAIGVRQQGIQQNVSSTISALPVIYGRSKIGAKIVETRVDPNSLERRSLARVGALCLGSEDGSGIAGIDEIYFDDRLAYDAAGTLQPEFIKDGVPKADLAKYTGTNSQAADGELVGRFAEWTLAGSGRGIAYIRLILTYHKEVYPQGIPNLTAVVRGQKVFDPRDSSTAWSENPALCIRDYITSVRYGLGVPASEIDEQSFIDAANFCEEQVSIPGGGTQDRFTCNGFVDTGRSMIANLEDLLSSCRGDLIYQGGKFRLIIRKVTAPTSFKLDETNIVGDWNFVRSGVQETANKVNVVFIDPDQEFQPNEIAWPEADQINGFLTDDNGFENQIEIDLPYTQDLYMAQQIGMVLLKESRADVLAEVTATEAALTLQVGDVVPLSHSTPGWDEKEFRVIGLGIQPDNTVRLALQEYDAGAYSLDPQDTKDVPPGTELPDPFNVDPPTGVLFESSSITALTTQEGNIIPRIKISWDRSVDPFLDHYRVQFKKQDNPNWTAAPNPDEGDIELYLTPVTNGEDYDIRIAAVNRLGIESAFVSGTITVSTQNSTGVGPSEGNVQISESTSALVLWRGEELSPAYSFTVSAQRVDGIGDRVLATVRGSGLSFALGGTFSIGTVIGGTDPASPEFFIDGTGRIRVRLQNGVNLVDVLVYAERARVITINPPNPGITVMDVDAGIADYGSAEPGRLNETGVQGRLRNVANTRGLLITGHPTDDDTLGGTEWLRYLNLSNDSFPFLKHDKLQLNTDGSAEFQGDVTAGGVVSEDGLFDIDLSIGLLTVLDEQTIPETRVRLGNLGVNPEDYGLEVYDQTGALILGADGLGVSVVARDQIVDGEVIAEKLTRSSQAFNSDIAFTSSDVNTVAWAAGTLEMSDGTTFNILAGNTGDMVARTYVYLDPAISTTVLQITTNYSTAVGEDIVLLAVCEPGSAATGDAFFIAFHHPGVVNAAQINAVNLSSISGNIGTIVSGWLGNADPASATAAIRLAGATAIPASNFIDFTAAGTVAEMVSLGGLTITGQGDSTFSGDIELEVEVDQVGGSTLAFVDDQGVNVARFRATKILAEEDNRVSFEIGESLGSAKEWMVATSGLRLDDSHVLDSIVLGIEDEGNLFLNGGAVYLVPDAGAIIAPVGTAADRAGDGFNHSGAFWVEGTDWHFIDQGATERILSAGGGGGGGLTQTTADGLYVNVTGDTMTGLLAVSPTATDVDVLYVASGGGGGGIQGKTWIALSPWSGVRTNPHARIGVVEENAGSFQGDLVFQTRGSESDVAPTTKLTIHSGGEVIANVNMQAPTFFKTSSRRWKENIEPWALDRTALLALQPVEYDLIEEKGGAHGYSFIAEDVAPLFASENRDAIDFDRITTQLVAGYQDHESRLAALETKVGA